MGKNFMRELLKMQILSPTLRILILKVWESVLLTKHPGCFLMWPLVHTENVIIPELRDAVPMFFSKQVRWGRESYNETGNVTFNHLSLRVYSPCVAFFHVQWRFCISWSGHFQKARSQGCPGSIFCVCGTGGGVGGPYVSDSS